MARSAITSDEFLQALVNADVVRKGEHIRRVVIDAQYGEAIVIYVERFGDARILDVATTLDAAQIRVLDVTEVGTARPLDRECDECGHARSIHGTVGHWPTACLASKTGCAVETMCPCNTFK